MRILVVSQYFWPENFRINDLCAEFQKRGHEITVLTGTPNYPGGNGGSGIVVIRGPSAVAFAGSPCCAFTGSTHPGGDKIAKFTASGTLVVTKA